MITNGLVKRIYFDTKLLGRAFAMAVIIKPRHPRQGRDALRVRLISLGLLVPIFGGRFFPALGVPTVFGGAHERLRRKKLNL
jgi:hypothetical protein